MEELFNLANYKFNYGMLPSLVAFCIFAFYAILGLIRGRNISNLVFALLFFLGIMPWQVSYLIFFTAKLDFIAEFAAKYLNLFGLVNIPILSFIFLLTILEKVKKHLFFVVASVVAFYTIFFLNIFTDYFIYTVKKYWFGYFAYTQGILGYVLFVVISLVLVYSTFLTIKQYKAENSPAYRMRLKWTLAAIFTIWVSVLEFLIVFDILIFFPFIHSISFAISAVIMYYITFKLRFFKLLPKFSTGQMIATMDDVVLVIDPRKRIISVNEAALKTLEYKKTDLLGKDMGAIFDSTNILERVVLLGSVQNKKIILTSSKGKKIIFNASASIIKSDNILRKTKGYVIVAKNMSVLKNALKRVTVATAKLTQAQKKLAMHAKKLEQFNKLAVGRDLKMEELKKQIKHLQQLKK